MYTERNPNSTNTLGFDLLKTELPNFENHIIDGGTTQATLQFKTKADWFYLFFVAFETEIDQSFYQDKRELAALDMTDEHLSYDKINLNEISTTAPAIPETLSQSESSALIIQDKKNLNIENADIREIENKKSITIPFLDSGYYLVTNVFSNIDNANKWLSFLKGKGHSPKTCVNPKNNWHYIYIFSNIVPYLVLEKKNEIQRIEYFKKIWILKINMN